MQSLLFSLSIKAHIFIPYKPMSVAMEDYINVLHEASGGQRELDVLLQRELLPNASCREHCGGLAVLRTHTYTHTKERDGTEIKRKCRRMHRHKRQTTCAVDECGLQWDLSPPAPPSASPETSVSSSTSKRWTNRSLLLR